jgi:hypothetical protein
LTLAHAAATFAAGVFGFLAVFGLREVAFAIAGPARFRRISALLQATLAVPLWSALLVLPMARHWLTQGVVTAKVLPPLWFVGLHEILAGSVIDTVPRTHPSWFPPGLIASERDATSLYRSLWPLYHELAFLALAALIIAVVVTTAACLWNSRQLPTPLVRRAHDEQKARRALKWIAMHAIARMPLRQAGFFFTLQTLSRQASHRVALAASLAIGLSLMLITAPRRLVPVNEVSDVASVSVALLAGQSLLLASVLTGFRHAVRIPAELAASSTFTLAWTGNATPYISGLKLAGWMLLVLPALGGLFIWHAIVLGIRLAALHFGVGVVVSVLLMEGLFVRCRLVPLVSGYVPFTEPGARNIVCAATLLLGSLALAWVERFALSAPGGYLVLVATLIGLSAGVRTFDRASRRPATPIDLDEPPQLPTQRLDLAT